MSHEFVGEGRERRESFAALKLGGVIIILGIYAMLAIPFKSYSQPLIVMGIILQHHGRVAGAHDYGCPSDHERLRRAGHGWRGGDASS